MSENDLIPIVRDEEGKDVNAETRQNAKLAFIFSLALASAIGVFSGSLGLFVAANMVFFVIFALIFTHQAKENEEIVHNRRAVREREQREASRRILEMQISASKILSELQARKIGDVIIAGQGATVISRSYLVGSMNRAKDDGNDKLSDALKVVAGFIEGSENKQAAEYFNAFTKRVEAGEQDKATLKSLWKSTVDTLPDLKKLGESTPEIHKWVKLS